MGLTSSLFAGLSGMKTNEFRMDVIGNNIANVNTIAYKSSRATFQTQFSNTFSFGSAPNGAVGGTNPMQVGTGVQVGAISKNFTGGAPETTGVKTDLAIQGQGLFILKQANGSQVYTRDGSFQFNAENYLLSADGNFLQGYTVDNDFNIVEGTLENIRIPLGEVVTASITSEAVFAGDLNGGGDVPAARPVAISSSALVTAGAVPATVGTALTALVDGSGAQLLYDDNVLTLAEASKGGANLPVREFIVGTTGSTVQEYMDWLDEVLGIVTVAEEPNLLDLSATGVDNPGIVLADGTGTHPAGTIVITSNIGDKNEIALASGAITASQGAGLSPPANSAPFTFNNFVTTNLGEGARTSFRGYDSLGMPIDIVITFALESKDNNGITWRFFVESGDDTDTDRFLNTGTMLFDTQGNYLQGTGLSFAIDRDNTGAQTPQGITLDFSNMDGFAMDNVVSMLSQDGFAAGTLQDFSVGPDGIIVGSFTNGLTRNLGQVVLATFRNYEGLISRADSIYATGPNSGDAVVKEPLALGAGSITPGALELSNVDLSREFINLIVSSTGFSASSRVIQTSDQLLTELMMLMR